MITLLSLVLQFHHRTVSTAQELKCQAVLALGERLSLVYATGGASDPRASPVATLGNEYHHSGLLVLVSVDIRPGGGSSGVDPARAHRLGGLCYAGHCVSPPPAGEW